QDQAQTMPMCCKRPLTIPNIALIRGEYMSKSNGVTEMTLEDAQEVMQAVGAVNLDEVTNEVVRIKVSEFQEVEETDDQGNTTFDSDGNPFKRRKPYTRTAEIYDLVTLPLYNEMVKLRAQMQNNKVSQEDAIGPMGKLVYKVWQKSEPWVTEEHFYEII